MAEQSDTTNPSSSSPDRAERQQHDIHMENWRLDYDHAIAQGLSHEEACVEGAKAGFSIGKADCETWFRRRATS